MSIDKFHAWQAMLIINGGALPRELAQIIGYYSTTLVVQLITCAADPFYFKVDPCAQGQFAEVRGTVHRTNYPCNNSKKGCTEMYYCNLIENAVFLRGDRLIVGYFCAKCDFKKKRLKDTWNQRKPCDKCWRMEIAHTLLLCDECDKYICNKCDSVKFTSDDDASDFLAYGYEYHALQSQYSHSMCARCIYKFMREGVDMEKYVKSMYK